jgi:hypothetical protein
MTDWITECMERLSLNNKIDKKKEINVDYYIYKNNDNEKEFKKILKTSKLRCLIIIKKFRIKIDPIIEIAKNSNVKNIIIQEYESEGKYCNERMIEKFIEINKDRLQEKGYDIEINNITVEKFLGREILLNILEWIMGGLNDS